MARSILMKGQRRESLERAKVAPLWAPMVLALFPLLMAAHLTGCAQSGDSSCGGLVCPSGRVCSPELNLCVAAAQKAACEGATDGSPCQFGEARTGECQLQVCVERVCGDGIRTSDEVCDDGNGISGDGCDSTCRSLESCGNGIVDLEVGEACDCGDGISTMPEVCPGPNSDQGDALCSGACQFRGCGDGIVVAPEDCEGEVVETTCVELGFDDGRLGCSNCRFDTSECTGFCGDGTVDRDEVCDGATPVGFSCVDYGFDFGKLGCTSGCVPDRADCSTFGPRELEPAPASIRELVGDADGTLIAATKQGLLRRSGNSWSAIFEGDFRFISRRGRRIAAIGAEGLVVNFDGSEWTSSQSPAVSPRDLCVTERGTLVLASEGVFRIEGENVTRSKLEPTDDASCASSAGRDYVLAAGRLYRDEGRQWSLIPVPPNVRRITSDPNGELLAVAGRRLYSLPAPGGAWTELPRVPQSVEVTDMVANSRGELAAVSNELDDGDVALYRNGAWYVTYAPASRYGVAVDANQEFVAYEGNRLFRLTPNLWTDLGFSAERVWLWNGRPVLAVANQIFFPSSPGTRSTILTMAGRAVGFSGAGHRAIAADDSGNIVELIDGQAQLVRPGDGSVLTDLSSEFAVGRDGVVLERATGWRQLELGIPESLFAVHTDAKGETLIVGSGGLVAHRRNDAWRVRRLEPTVSLTGVWRSDNGGPWLLSGSEGYLAWFDGDSASRIETGTKATLRAIAGTSSDNVLVIGDAAAALYFDGARWTPLRLPAEVGAGAMDLASGPDEVVVVVGSRAYGVIHPSFSGPH